MDKNVERGDFAVSRSRTLYQLENGTEATLEQWHIVRITRSSRWGTPREFTHPADYDDDAVEPESNHAVWLITMYRTEQLEPLLANKSREELTFASRRDADLLLIALCEGEDAS